MTAASPPAPAVSVILPTQGRRNTLARAIASVQAQTWTDWELLVVDDAPADAPDWTDASNPDGWRADPRVRLIRSRQARGCAAAKNVGLQAARGRWVAYLDDDNWYAPGKLAAQVTLAEMRGAPLVLCGIEYQVGARRRQRQVDRVAFAGEDLALAVLADTNLLFHRRAGSPAWDEALETADDACFFHAWRRAAGLVEVPNVPEPLVHYVVHAGPRANVDRGRLERGHRRLRQRWLVDFAPATRRRCRLRMVLADLKYRPGRWRRFIAVGVALLRSGGWAELRTVVNALLVKVPVAGRWAVR